MDFTELPKDFFLDIENNEFLLGRITINQYKSSFTSEIDIVTKESMKIYKHVDSLFDLEDPKEALDQSVFRLQNFLHELSKG